MSLVLSILTDLDQLQTWIALAQLIFTIVSIIVICVTLNLQAKTLKSQMEVQRLQTVHSRIKLKPVISIEAHDTWIGDGLSVHEPSRKKITFKTTIRSNHLTNLKLKVNAGTIGEVYYEDFQITQIDREKVFVEGEVFHFICEIDWEINQLQDSNRYKYYFDFLISYDDMLGIRYGQGVRYYPEAKAEELHPREIPARND